MPRSIPHQIPHQIPRQLPRQTPRQILRQTPRQIPRQIPRLVQTQDPVSVSIPSALSLERPILAPPRKAVTPEDVIRSEVVDNL